MKWDLYAWFGENEGVRLRVKEIAVHFPQYTNACIANALRKLYDDGMFERERVLREYVYWKVK